MDDHKKEALEDLGYHDPTLGPAPLSDMNGLMEEIMFHKEFSFIWHPQENGYYLCHMRKSYKDRVEGAEYWGPLNEDFLQWINDAMREFNKHEV